MTYRKCENDHVARVVMRNDIGHRYVATWIMMLFVVLALCFLVNEIVLAVIISVSFLIFCIVHELQSPHTIVLDRNGIVCRRRFKRDLSFFWEELAAIYFFSGKEIGQGPKRTEVVVWIVNSTKKIHVSSDVGNAIMDGYFKATGKRISNEKVG
jgi:hypothetical protein